MKTRTKREMKKRRDRDRGLLVGKSDEYNVRKKGDMHDARTHRGKGKIVAGTDSTLPPITPVQQCRAVVQCTY